MVELAEPRRSYALKVCQNRKAPKGKSAGSLAETRLERDRNKLKAPASLA
jgi:hypothetical protein